MKSKKKLLLLIIFVAIQTNLFSQKKIPNLTLTSISGEPIQIANKLPKNKIIILSFWATWCIPCINELDAISEVYPDWQEETNVELIAISIDDSRTLKRVKPMVNGKGWDYKIWLDKNQELKRALNISLVPYTLIVKNNKILHKSSGYTPGDEDKFLRLVKKISKQ